MTNPQLVEQNKPEQEVKWYVRDRWGLIPTLTGILIVAFVIVTGGERGAWLLWIAIPFLMIGLGYLFVVNAVRHFMT